MSKNQSPAEQSPLLINTLTSELIQHQGLNIINRPDGVTLAWEPQEGFNMNEAARENGFKNIRQDNYPQNGSGDAGSLVSVEMSHDEYDEFRQKPHLQSLKLAPIAPEATGNTLGQLTFMPSVSNVRAEYANPPEPPPEEQTPETDNSQPNEHLQALIDESEDERSYWQRTKEGAASAWNGTQRIAEASWDNPGEFGKGVLKGAGNLFSDLWNLAVTASKAQNGRTAYSYLLDKMALSNYEDGNLARANSLASQSASILESGIVGDIFELDNDAQTGGSIASILVPVGAVVKAPASLAKAARGTKSLDTAADTAKIADTSSDVLKADKTADPTIANTASNASTAKKAPDASAASKVKEPTGPAGNGGKVIASKRLKKTDVPCFKKNKKGAPKEYDRQLKGQQDGLNNMTAKEYLDGRAAYTGKRANTTAKRKRYEESLIEGYMSSGISKTNAKMKASAKMKTLNALHNPDMFAGGKDLTTDWGDAGVNKSIGSQWKSRVLYLDNAAEDAINNGQNDHKMNASMHRCP